MALCGKRQWKGAITVTPHGEPEVKGGDCGEPVEGEKAKFMKKQHRCQGSDTKILQKDYNLKSKREKLGSLDSLETAGSHLRRCEQQGSLAGFFRSKQECHSHHVQQTNRKQQQQPVPRTFSLTKNRVEQGLRSLKGIREQEVVSLQILPPSTGTQNSMRVAQRLAPARPLSPPLKLPKLQLVLTRKEIQEDWIRITGHRYAGKPRKSTLVQRGLGLCTALTCPSSIRYLNNN